MQNANKAEQEFHKILIKLKSAVEAGYYKYETKAEFPLPVSLVNCQAKPGKVTVSTNDIAALAHTLIDEIKRYDESKSEELAREFDKIDAEGWPYVYERFVFGKVFGTLDMYSPPEHYFGYHPNHTDIGYWPYGLL